MLQNPEIIHCKKNCVNFFPIIFSHRCKLAKFVGVLHQTTRATRLEFLDYALVAILDFATPLNLMRLILVNSMTIITSFYWTKCALQQNRPRFSMRQNVLV